MRFASERRWSRLRWIALALALAGCTELGPLPSPVAFGAGCQLGPRDFVAVHPDLPDECRCRQQPVPPTGMGDADVTLREDDVTYVVAGGAGDAELAVFNMLTVEAGVCILFEEGARLVTAPGGSLNVRGEKNDAVVLRSTVGERWEGVALVGDDADPRVDLADERAFDPPTIDLPFGAGATADCGTLRFLRIEGAGAPSAPRGEQARLAALTLAGCGAATTVDLVQVSGARGDGVHVLGGSVALDWLVVNDAGRNALLVDYDWPGAADGPHGQHLVLHVDDRSGGPPDRHALVVGSRRLDAGETRAPMRFANVSALVGPGGGRGGASAVTTAVRVELGALDFVDSAFVGYLQAAVLDGAASLSVTGSLFYHPMGVSFEGASGLALDEETGNVEADACYGNALASPYEPPETPPGMMGRPPPFQPPRGAGGPSGCTNQPLTRETGFRGALDPEVGGMSQELVGWTAFPADVAGPAEERPGP